MTIHNIYVRDYPGANFRWNYLAPDEVTSQEALADLALQAVFAFGDDFCVPLSVDIKLTYVDAEMLYEVTESAPTQQFTLLRQRDFPSEVTIKPIYIGEAVHDVEVVDARTIRDYLAAAFAQPNAVPANLVLGWEELNFNATHVRLPDGLVSSQASTIQISMPRGTVSYPVEHCKGSMWVAGPYQPSIFTAPIDIRVNKTSQLLELNVMVYWNVWTDPASIGYKELQQAFGRLEALGWQQVQ